MTVDAITLLALLGCITGFASGASAAGSPVAVALLVLVLPILGIADPDVGRIAGATSIALIVVINIGSLTAHLQRGSVDWRMFALLGPGLLIGTILAALAAPRLPPSLLALAFAAFATLTAWRLLYKSRAVAEVVKPDAKHAMALSLRGFWSGVIAALLGTGTGTIAIPAMARFLPMPRVLGTNVALALPMALAATATYLNMPQMCSACIGYVYLPALAAMGIGAVLTVPLGVWLSHVIPDHAVRVFFALALIIAAANLVYRTMDGAALAQETTRVVRAAQMLWRQEPPVAATVPAWLSPNAFASGEASP